MWQKNCEIIYDPRTILPLIFFLKAKIELQTYSHSINKGHVNISVLHPPPIIQLQTNKMSHFNKNLSPLLLLALFIIVTNFSMNAEAATIEIYNNVTAKNLNATANCQNTKVDFSPTEIAYGDKYVINDTLRVFCSFKWQRGSFSIMEIYDSDHYICDPCLWSLQPRGLCYNATGPTFFVYCFDYDH